MIQRLGDLTIFIPLREIYRSQRYYLNLLHKSIIDSRHYIGELKMSVRQTIITMSYLFALMKRGTLLKIYYLCETKQRCNQVEQICVKIRQQLKKFQKNNPLQNILSEQNLQRSFRLQSNDSITIHTGFFHKELQKLIKDYPQERYISIMTINEYFKEFIKMKIQNNHKKVKTDYFFMETKAYDQIVQNIISGYINQIFIRRAHLQHKRLYKYYHERDDKKLKLNSQTNLELNKRSSLNRSSSNISLEKKKTSVDNHHRHSFWSVSQTQKKIHQVYNKKKEQISKRSQNTQISASGIQQEGMIMLGITGYILNYLQSLQKQMKKDKDSSSHKSSADFLQQLMNKLVLSDIVIAKCFESLKKFFRVHPPIVQKRNSQQKKQNENHNSSKNDQVLSTRYILLVTQFFYNLIKYHKKFDPERSKCISVIKTRQNDTFQLKFKCLDQVLLTNLILEDNKCFSVVMNVGISFQFYSNFFKPRYLMDIQDDQSHHHFKFSFQTPQKSFNYTKPMIYGLNINITPSEEDLKIPQKSDDLQHYSEILRTYGVFLHDVCQIISDGVVVFFPNLTTMIDFRRQWQKKEKIYQRINQIKKVFQQTEYEKQNIQNLREYKRLCDIGRGGVYLLSQCHGMSKYHQFQNHYSRCIIFMGFPKPPSHPQLSQKINYLSLKQSQIKHQLGMKTVAKCLCSCINSCFQPKTVLFADVSFNSKTTKKWFPFIQLQGNLNTLSSMQKIKRFNQNSQKKFVSKIKQERVNHQQKKFNGERSQIYE